MKKLFRTAIILALMLFVSLALFSCGKELEGVTFENSTLTYTGAEQTVEVKGAPEGATVTYSPSNKLTEAGTYEITATVKAEGYDDKVLKATVIVAPKTLTVDWINKGPFGNIGKAPTFKYTLEGVAEGDEVTLAFDFGEYDFKKAGTKPVTVTATNKNYTLKAEDASFDVKFGAVDCTVSFETGVDTELSDETVRAGKKVDTPRTLNNLGYTFDGWYYGDKKWDFENDIVEEDMTLTAKWIPTEYKINYYLNGGVNAPANPETFTFDKGASIQAPTREGYVFLGWFEDIALSVPMQKIEAEKIRKNVSLYAAWTDVDYTELISKDTLDETFVREKSMANGSFRYTFAANVKSFSEDGVIYIGRGKDTVDGSYISVDATKIVAVTNGASNPINSDSRNHGRELSGFVVIDVIVENGMATVTLTTENGSFTANLAFSARNGEIFVCAEGCELVNATFGWYAGKHEEDTWILGESSIGTDSENIWTSHLTAQGFDRVLMLAAEGADSTDVLAAFKSLLDREAPKYAIWSFDTESGAEYDANLQEFISVCKEKDITPVLTTQLTAINAANEAKNSAVVESGERYIDFAALAAYTGITEAGDYTELGAQSMFAKVLTDLPEIITPNTLLHEDKADKLDANDNKLTVGANRVRDGKYLVFTAKLNTLGDGAKITIAHGIEAAYTKWFDITSTQLLLHSKGAAAGSEIKTREYAHGLSIKNYITVIVSSDKDNLGYSIIILTDGGYKKLTPDLNCSEGEIFVAVDGIELTDAKLNWTCVDYEKPIWFIGASYFSLNDPARWPYYMYQEDYTDDIFIAGRGGINTTSGMAEFEDALKYGTPKYLVWGIGMNDGADSDDADPMTAVKESYYKNIPALLEICKQNGIKAYIFNMPECERRNTAKLAILNGRLGNFANYDYEVIDIARAIGGYEYMEEFDYTKAWYPNMLHSDGVHPTNLGAKNFYLETLCDFPQLMGGVDANIKTATADNLATGTQLTLTPDAVLKTENVFTFKADFEGSLSGAIEVGSGKGVNGGTWISIDSDQIKVYHNVNGEDVVIHTEANPFVMKEIVMVRIRVHGSTASISIASSEEKNYDSANSDLFDFECGWSMAGDVFATSTGESLTNAELNWFTA